MTVQTYSGFEAELQSDGRRIFRDAARGTKTDAFTFKLLNNYRPKTPLTIVVEGTMLWGTENTEYDGVYLDFQDNNNVPLSVRFYESLPENQGGSYNKLTKISPYWILERRQKNCFYARADVLAMVLSGILFIIWIFR